MILDKKRHLLILISFILVCFSTYAAGNKETKVPEVNVKVEVDKVEDEAKPRTDPNYNSSINNFSSEGSSISIPPSWTCLSNVSATDSSQVFKAVSPDGSFLSLHKIYFEFSLNELALIKSVEDQINNTGEVIRIKDFDLGLDFNRGKLYAWQLKNETSLNGLIIESREGFNYEWRYQIPKNVSESELDIINRIIQEAKFTKNTNSMRKTSNNIMFNSEGGSWRWIGDLGDGFMLESLVPQDTYSIIASVFRLNSIENGEEWYANLETEGWKKESELINMRGEPRYPQILSLVTPGLIVRFCIIFPDPNNKLSPLCIYFYVRNIKDNPKTVSEILSHELVQNLLNYNLIIPRSDI
ncbi:MAG: hypothetical protein OCD02_17910 [Spirochaetaceae bacterium]